MKDVCIPLEVISINDVNGNIRPMRFRYLEEDAYKVITVDSVITRTEEKYAGENNIVFRCKSEIDNVSKPYEIKYDLNRCKWSLCKI